MGRVARITMSSEEKIISKEEFLKHQSAESLWICYRGKVLDVTEYQMDHPGSDTVLLDNAGKDSTEEFDDVGHTPEAKTKRDSLVIGRLTEEDMQQLPGYKEHADEPEDDASGFSLGMIAPLIVLAAVAYAVFGMN